MRRSSLAPPLIAALLCVSCGSAESGADPSDRTDSADEIADPTDSDSTEPRRTTTRPIEEDQIGWFAAGTGGDAGLINREGSTPSRTAQVRLAGRGIDDGAPSGENWLLASSDGWVQLRSAQKGPLSVLGEDEQLLSVEPGNGAWLALGADGTVERVDGNGQPTGQREEPFGASVELAGAGFRSSSWLVATSSGSLKLIDMPQFRPADKTLSVDGPVVDVVASTGRWIAFTDNGFVPVSGDETGAPQTLLESGTITTATAADDRIAVGTDDGRVLVASNDALGSASPTDVLGGTAVEALARDGDRWIVAGQEGKVALLDASGSTAVSARSVANSGEITTAAPTEEGWGVGVREFSAVQSLGADLATTDAEQSDLLEGADVRTVAPRPGGMLVAGDDGSYRMLEPGGEPSGDVRQLESNATIRAAGWDGEQFLVAGDDGRVALVAPSGEVQSTSTHLDGTTIQAVAWSGDFWMIAGRDGSYRQLRRDGSTYLGVEDSELATIRDTQFNGDQYILAGHRGDRAAFVLIAEQGDVAQSATEVPAVEGRFQAVGWNGREWLAGTDTGWVARIDQAGSVISQGQTKGVRRALRGFAVRAISFNGTRYLIAGEHGAVRRLENDALPIGSAVVVNDFSTVRSVAWTDARGFWGGPCVSNDFCLNGQCLGRIGDGFCCESACDSPCESCRNEVTGEPDGRCTPMPEGEPPPERKQMQDNDCAEGSKSSCGQTGVCDGEGSCAYYGTDVVCQEASCSGGEAQPKAQCDGEGSCVVPEKTSCMPYRGCDGTSCPESCESDDDCVPGYVCRDATCIDRDEAESESEEEESSGEESEDSPDGDGGCGCSSSSGTPGSGLALLAVALLGLLRRHRSSGRSASR